MQLENLVKHTLFIGLNDKDSKVQEVTREQAVDIIQNACGDCTISDANGCYTHNNGEIVKENTLRVELLFKADADVVKACKVIKEKLNQESIALNREVVASALI